MNIQDYVSNKMQAIAMLKVAHLSKQVFVTRKGITKYRCEQCQYASSNPNKFRQIEKQNDIMYIKLICNRCARRLYG